MPSLQDAFDIVAVADVDRRPLDDAMTTYFRLGIRLELNWLRDRILELPRANRWQALARAALRDDLQSLHRQLTCQVLDGRGRSELKRRRDRSLGGAPRGRSRALARGPRRDQGLAELRHHDAAGRAPRGTAAARGGDGGEPAELGTLAGSAASCQPTATARL